MNAWVKRNWWIPAPIALIGLGAYTMLTHVVEDGYESPWSHAASGWDPSLLERAGTVVNLVQRFMETGPEPSSSGA